MTDDKLMRMEFEALCHKLGLSPEKYLGVAYFSDSNTICAFDIYNAAVRATAMECARIALGIWDSGREGAHGGEQANRTAAEIRARFGLDTAKEGM